MKGQFVLIVVLAIVGATAAAGGLGSRESGHAAADPPTHIKAEFKFVDDGTTLKVSGEARGMAPTETYASLVYDVGSFAEGPGACAPSIFNPLDPDFIQNTMFLGVWEVEPPRVFRRPHCVRGWGYGKTKQILPGGPRASGADGRGARERARLTVGCDPLDRVQDRLYGRNTSKVGAADRA